jgi:hypothetical protein
MMTITMISAAWKAAAETGGGENGVACECLGSFLFLTKRGNSMGTVPGFRFRYREICIC